MNRAMDTGTSPPTIVRSRIRLVPFAGHHLTPGYVHWLNDAETTRYSEQRHRRHTLDSCKSYVEAMQSSGHYLWAIEWTEDGAPRHIGNLSATLDRPNGVADLAIMVGERDARGRGLGRDAWIAACEWLLGPGGFRKISAGTMAENRAMLAVFDAAGMTIEAVRRSHFVLDGRPTDAIYAALFSPLIR
jgi:[ribosomal protein S5]-alanine N-acetyltransferase